MRRWAIFTDLDGTLLDHADFRYDEARGILGRLRDAGVPVVPVTSKTFDEVEPLANELGLEHAFVFESGGGIARRSGSEWVIEERGVAAERLRVAIAEIEETTGARFALYSELPDAAASHLSGLTGEALARSRRRRFDEPFVLEQGDIGDVMAAARAKGLSVWRGGRFHHLCGRAGKGDAVDQLRGELPVDTFVVALGDAPMDADFLHRADLAILVPRRGEEVDTRLRRALPDAETAPAPAPEGWAAAVGSVWERVEAGQL